MALQLKYGQLIKRGKKRGEICDIYTCTGLRKDPKGTDIGDYALKRSTPEEAKERIRVGITLLNKRLIEHSIRLFPQTDTAIQNVLRNELQISAITGWEYGNVQFSSGKGQ